MGLFVLLNQAAAERARLAEARRRAEAYETFSASTADQLGDLLRTTLRKRPGTAPDHMEAALSKLRNSTNILKSRGIVPSSTLGVLEFEIGWALMYASKAEEARDLLNQAAADLGRSLVKTSEDKETRHCLCSALFLSGCLAEEEGQFEAALNCFEQTAAIQMEIEPSDSNHALHTALYKRLQLLADRLGQSGRTGQEEHARHISQQILRHLLGSEIASSTDASYLSLETLVRVFQRFDLKKMAAHEVKKIRSDCERFVAPWLAISVGPSSPFRSSLNAATYGRDPEAVAIALISAIRDRCPKVGLADSMVPAAFDVIRNDAADLASEQRRLGRLDDVHETAARLMTLARRLVREYPDSAVAYRVLSEAHTQIKKNAFRTGDDNLIEQSLAQAVKAAQRSLALDPDRLETRGYLDKITEQLASVKADRHAMGSSIP